MNISGIQNNITESVSLEETSYQSWHFSLLAVIMAAYYGSFIVYLAYKHWSHLGPVHLYELKGLLDMTVWATVITLQGLVAGPDCSTLSELEYAANWCWHIAVTAGQMEMFRSVYSNVYYDPEMGRILAMAVCPASTIAMWLLAPVSTHLLPAAVLCPVDGDFCAYFQPEKFYLNTVPMVFCLAVILAVGAYITYIKFHIPVPVYTISIPQPPPYPPPPVLHDLTVENIEEEAEDDKNSSPPPRPPAPSPPDCSTMGRVPTVSADVAWTQTVEERIRRKDSNPHIFFRTTSPRPPPGLRLPSLARPVQVAPQPKPQPHVILQPPGVGVEVMENIRKYLAVNIINLITMGLMIPENVVFVYVFLTGVECSTSEKLRLLINGTLPVQIVFALSLPYLVKRKLDNFKS